MLFIITFCVFIFILGCLASARKIRNGLEIAFIFLFLFSALRYDFGNDFPFYSEDFIKISHISSLQSLLNLYDGPFDKYIGYEIGWAILCFFFKSLGFELLLVFTSFITCIVYYKFIKRYVPVRWYWFSLFIYVFNPYLFFVPLSMMRQSLCMVIFIMAFGYIYNKKIVQSILLILFAVLFHKSAVILLPFSFLGYVSKINGKVISIAYSVAFFLLLLTKDLTSNIIEIALNASSFESYVSYFEKLDRNDADDFGLGFAARLLTFFIPFLLYYSDKMEKKSPGRLIAFISGFSFLIAPFTKVLGMIGRVDYYFIIYSIVAFPILYNWIKNKNKYVCYSLIALFIAFTLYTYYLFFMDPLWKPFTSYNTILFK